MKWSVVEVGLGEALGALGVEDEARVGDALLPVDPGDDLLRTGHLGHALRVDEADRLDRGQARGGEPVHELRAHGAGASVSASFWSPSRGPTSQMVTCRQP